MNFSQVKAITIPEGSVKSITDSLGRILWSKVSDIKTLWTGEAILTQNSSTGFPFSINNISVPSGNSLKLRLTFSKLINNASDMPSRFIGKDNYSVYVAQYPENENVIVDIEVNSDFDKVIYQSSGNAVSLRLKYTNNTLTFTSEYSSSTTDTAELKLIKVQQILLDELVEGISINKTTSSAGNNGYYLPSTICRLYAKGAQDSVLEINNSIIYKTSMITVVGNIGRIGHGVNSLILRSYRQKTNDVASYYKLYLNGTSISPTTTTTNYFEWTIDLTGVSEITDYHAYASGSTSSSSSNTIEVTINTI